MAFWMTLIRHDTVQHIDLQTIVIKSSSQVSNNPKWRTRNIIDERKRENRDSPIDTDKFEMMTFAEPFDEFIASQHARQSFFFENCSQLNIKRIDFDERIEPASIFPFTFLWMYYLSVALDRAFIGICTRHIRPFKPFMSIQTFVSFCVDRMRVLCFCDYVHDAVGGCFSPYVILFLVLFALLLLFGAHSFRNNGEIL